MLTSRGWWLLFVGLLQIIVGLLLADRSGTGPSIAMIGLVILVWIFAEWVLFRARVVFAASNLQVLRSLQTDGRTVSVLWAGQEFDVVVEIALDSRVSLPYVLLQDRPPSGCDRVSGRDDCVARLSAAARSRCRTRALPGARGNSIRGCPCPDR